MLQGTAEEVAKALITVPGAVEGSYCSLVERGWTWRLRKAEDKPMSTVRSILHDHDHNMGAAFHTETLKKIQEAGIS